MHSAVQQNSLNDKQILNMRESISQKIVALVILCIFCPPSEKTTKIGYAQAFLFLYFIPTS